MTYIRIRWVVTAGHVGMWRQTTFGDQSVDFFLSSPFKLQIFVVRVLRLLIDLELNKKFKIAQ